MPSKSYQIAYSRQIAQVLEQAAIKQGCSAAEVGELIKNYGFGAIAVICLSQSSINQETIDQTKRDLFINALGFFEPFKVNALYSLNTLPADQFYSFELTESRQVIIQTLADYLKTNFDSIMDAMVGHGLSTLLGVGFGRPEKMVNYHFKNFNDVSAIAMEIYLKQ